MSALRAWRRAAAACALFAALALAVALAGAGSARAAGTGLVAAYNFNAGSGSTLADVSGNGNDGTIAGAAWTTGKNGDALSFDGGSDEVTVPDSPSLDLSSGMTLEAWVDPTALGTSWRAVIFKDQPSEMVYSLYANDGAGHPIGQAYMGAEQNVTGPSSLPTGSWSHLAATYDGSNLRLYVNGSLVATKAQSGGIQTSGGQLEIGGDSVWPEWFQGKIDDVRIYNRALSASAIQSDMATPVAAPSAPADGPVAAYSFDAGSGSTLVDDAGDGNTGTISGAAWAAGKHGDALSFNGSSSVVTIPDSPALDLSNGMTLEAWVDPAQLGFWKTVLVKEQTGDLVYGLFADSDSAEPTGQVYSGGQQIVRGTSQLPLNTWTHLATTYDGQTQRIYVNGALVASRAQTGPMPASTGAFRIGGNTLWPNEYFQGKIDDVRVYDRALSASEIASDMKTAVSAVTDPPPPTGDTQAPSAPTGLGVTSKTQTSISVAWNLSTDNVAVAGYTLYKNGAAAGTAATGSASFAGLACGTSYTLAVDAYDAAGNHSGKTQISASTSACSGGGGGGASVFLSPGGSDGNPCTQSAPCASFDRAYHAASPGDVVQVAGGSYPAQPINADSSKTSSSDVLFEPAAGATVRMGQIDVYGSHLELRDLTIDGVNTYGTANDVTLRNITDTAGLFILSSQNVSVLGGSVGPAVDFHSMIVGEDGNPTPPRNILLDGVYFHDFTRSDTSVHTECLQIGAADGVTVRNSVFHHCDVMDMHITHFGSTPDTKNVTIENNFFETATSGGYYSIQAYAWHNLLIRNNSSTQAILIMTDMGPNDSVHLTGNVAPLDPWACVSGVFYSHNVWDGTTCGSTDMGPNDSVHLTGNVAPLDPWACVGGVFYSHNVWDGTTCGSTDIDAPSGFVNAAGGDFHLQPGAAAIDHGDPASYPPDDIDGQSRPLGGAPDAGADEAQ